MLLKQICSLVIGKVLYFLLIVGLYDFVKSLFLFTYTVVNIASTLFVSAVALIIV